MALISIFYHLPVSLSGKRTRHAPEGGHILTGPAASETPCEVNFGSGGECAMWKRDAAAKPAPPGGGPAAAGTGQSPNNINTSPAPDPARSSDLARGMEKGPVNIGKSVVIKGELTGSEDLTIEGH